MQCLSNVLVAHIPMKGILSFTQSSPSFFFFHPATDLEEIRYWQFWIHRFGWTQGREMNLSLHSLPPSLSSLPLCITSYSFKFLSILFSLYYYFMLCPLLLVTDGYEMFSIWELFTYICWYFPLMVHLLFLSLYRREIRRVRERIANPNPYTYTCLYICLHTKCVVFASCHWMSEWKQESNI